LGSTVGAGKNVGLRIDAEGVEDIKGAPVGISDWNAVGSVDGIADGLSVDPRIGGIVELEYGT
jgi:hypothetical protein